MFLRDKIISEAIAIVGSSNYAITSGNRADNAEKICGAFINSAIEEVYLSINWPQAIERIPRTDGDEDKFTKIAIADCVKVITISPSKMEWYINKKELYFKSDKLEGGFYYSASLLKDILANKQVDLPYTFSTLCAMYLASAIAHSLYSESVFTEGLRVAYLQKIEETRKLHQFNYHLVNSARFS
jgi:hypothetical protein